MNTLGGYIEGMNGDSVVSRLNKIRGQIDGIISMYEEERSCLDVVTQVSAARSALSSVGKELLSSEAVKCSVESDRDKLDRLLKQLFEIS